MLTHASRGDQRSPRPVPRVRWYVWLFAFSATLVAGAAADRGGNSRPLIDSNAAGSRTPSPHGDSLNGAWTGVIYMQASDCSGNLSIVRPLLAGRTLGRLSTVEIVDVSVNGDSTMLRSLLPPEMKRIPIRRIRDEEHRMLQLLGFRETPLVALRDNLNRVRLVTPTLSDASERVANGRAVFHLIHRDPSR